MTGELIYVATNAPGSWHDARIARSLYDRLTDNTPAGYFLIADTAFPKAGRGLEGRIKTPLKSGVLVPQDHREREAVLELNREITNARQAAEWGMRSIQGSFGRLRIPLPITMNHFRLRLLTCCFRLHQLRVRLVGINQIQTVYHPLWQGSSDQSLVNLSNRVFNMENHQHLSNFELVPDADGILHRVNYRN
jgi:hypothetical protein